MKNFFKRLSHLQKNRYVGMYLYRHYKYKIYPLISAKVRIEHVCTNSDGVKYELIHKFKPSRITFNNLEVLKKDYNNNLSSIWVPNEDGILNIDGSITKLSKQKNKKVTTDSIIIISDRYEKADDNGESFYEWLLKNKPEYKNIYFAISKSSLHYDRLKAKNFNMLDMDSRLFRKKYKNADVIVSSICSDYIENYKQLRYNPFSKTTTSRFICLQHGVTYLKNIESLVLFSKKINSFIMSSEFEKKGLADSSIWFNSQLPVCGFSRSLVEVEKMKEYFILYMPTWTQELLDISDVTKSNLFIAIRKLCDDVFFNEYLKQQQLKLYIVIHPQLNEQMKTWSSLENQVVKVFSGTEIEYQKFIGNSSVLLTDASSVFFDGIYRDKPIVFYHPEGVLKEEIEKFDGIGPIAKTERELTKKLKDIALSNYAVNVDSEFRQKNTKDINEKIWELVLNG